MLEGKYWKNGVPKAIKLTLLRNMSKQKQSENAGKRKKMYKKNELKRNPKKKKRVEMKMKRNKEGRPN